jgi:DNA polymerase-1
MDIAAYAAMAAAANPMPFTNAPAPMEGLVAHIDGDFCAYNCAGSDDTDPGQARRNLLSKFDSIKRASGATSVIVHLTDRASTKGERYLVATVKPYQGQRGGRKPKNWEVLREYMETYEGDRFKTKNWMTREADDGMAYVAHAAAGAGTLAVICTKDKDMQMLPGRHVIWDSKQLVEVPFGTFELIGPDGKTYGHKWFWLQMLMGDGADFIPGLPKYVTSSGKEAQCGEATAAKLLKGCTSNAEAFAVVSGLYAGYYTDDWSDRFVEQACLLWLRTDRHAVITNFMDIMPWAHSLHPACLRLVERVNEQRAILEGLRQ